MDTETTIENTETETANVETVETKTVREHVYVQYVQRLLMEAQSMGIHVQTEDKKGWVELSGSNGHRLCVQKVATKLPVLETTLAPEVCDGTPLPANKPNGRIQARIPATDMAAVAKALRALVDPANPIPAPKRGKGVEKEIPSLDALLAKAADEESESA